jgi:hypothetical protein
MYDGLATISDNFDLLAHTALMKSWEAPNSNWMMINIQTIRKYLHVLLLLDRGVVDTAASQCWGPMLTSLLNYY